MCSKLKDALKSRDSGFCYHTKSSAGQFLYTNQVIYPTPPFPPCYSCSGDHCGAQEMLQLLVSGWWETVQSSSALPSCPLSQTQYWAPTSLLGAMWPLLFLHSENNTHKSQSLSFTRPIFLMYTSPFILKGVLLEFSSVLCTSKEQFKCYCDKLLANTCISEVTDTLLLQFYSPFRWAFVACAWWAKIQLRCSQLPADRCELCVLQRLLNTLTSRFIQLELGISLKWAFRLPTFICTTMIPNKHEN